MKPINIDENCQFLKDCSSNSKIAMYNLIVAKGQLALFNKGILPTRSWRLKHVKEYFGMNGNKETMLNKINKLHEVLKSH